MNFNTEIDVFTISFLDDRGEIHQEACHHDLAKVHEISKHLISTQEGKGVFIQVERMTALNYWLNFGNQLENEERHSFEKQYELQEFTLNSYFGN